MADRKRASGVTLIEAMVAMAILVIGTVGFVGLHRAGAAMNGEARIVTRATALAQDLVDQMQLWDFTNDPRLVNTTTTNDPVFNDPQGCLERPQAAWSSCSPDPTPDHQESELESQAAPYTWLGVKSATAGQLGFTRYWSVAEVDRDANGALNAKRVAVIVRWQWNGLWRRVVLVTALQNPSNTN